MASIRKILAMAAVALSLGVVATTASASSAKPFHLDKTCESAVLCTIQASSFAVLAPGTDVTYTFDASDPWDGLAFPTIAVRNGTTTGVCDWNQPGPTVLAKCVFDAGTGRLTQFHLAVDVTVTGDPNSPDSVWHWDGTYAFGGAG